MIKVLLFAQLQEEVGQNELDLEFGPATVTELKQELIDKYKGLQLDEAMIAINEKYAKSDDIVTPGDTVAVIPPISGG
ncbi:MAG TPA: molybdopterin converting factor subunit 1 [Virgibacillus sp.]|nr:molybdopterin converting factor subunit 1 [Virgibacillus sp.]